MPPISSSPPPSPPSEPPASQPTIASTTYPDYVLRQEQLGLDMTAVITSYRRKTADWDTSLDDNFWRFVGNHPTAKQFSVNISELNLEESSPSTDPAKFLLVRPIDPVLMKQWLGEITSSPDLPDLSSLVVRGQPTDPSDRYHAASCLSGKVSSLVEELGCEGKTLFSPSLGRWPFMKDTPQSYMDGIYFAIEWVLDYQESGDELEPPSAPHSVAFLACMSPMRDDLLAQELLTIFRLAIHRFLTSTECSLTSTEGFRVVPVTLITVSGDNLRVLHAYIDDVSRIINVRKSKIYNININNLRVKGREQFWTLILQWVLATPDMQSVHDLEKRLPLAAAAGSEQSAAATTTSSAARRPPRIAERPVSRGQRAPEQYAGYRGEEVARHVSPARSSYGGQQDPIYRDDRRCREDHDYSRERQPQYPEEQPYRVERRAGDQARRCRGTGSRGDVPGRRLGRMSKGGHGSAQDRRAGGWREKARAGQVGGPGRGGTRAASSSTPLFMKDQSNGRDVEILLENGAKANLECTGKGRRKLVVDFADELPDNADERAATCGLYREDMVKRSRERWHMACLLKEHARAQNQGAGVTSSSTGAFSGRYERLDYLGTAGHHPVGSPPIYVKDYAGAVTELCAIAGHRLAPTGLDREVPWRYNACHAEKQLIGHLASRHRSLPGDLPDPEGLPDMLRLSLADDGSNTIERRGTGPGSSVRSSQKRSRRSS
ncbi:hypothetical protein GGTG_10976 [Gaeumannomyces tritici R3-111a-1]|uniref:Single-strand DNA deaminase toxin A-like C-terminal domain-containing protein n=1 Tax=Gaeumannomyces tritici (strain R3-111a-1) TaxID=644352 RepID=J3PBV4_GAET3|nr:hypothetical protein GGTG_10976 [Gaeumannomyces tritici R3-111a-1]EJT71722.1 hypothetical protein GGTG_10976 [Gaeumannomyces tritici R3-111a-1]